MHFFIETWKIQGIYKISAMIVLNSTAYVIHSTKSFCILFCDLLLFAKGGPNKVEVTKQMRFHAKDARSRYRAAIEARNK